MAEDVRGAAERPVGVARPAALLVSPSLAGHRVIYCRVLAGILAGEGYDVVLAGAPRGDRADPLLEDLLARPGVELHDVGAALRGLSLPLAAVATLAARRRAVVTILCEADDLVDELAVARPQDRPTGRLVGLFVRCTNEQYAPPPSAYRRVRARLRAEANEADAARSRALRTFDEGRLADASLVLDEQYVLQHPSSHRWLPDIYGDPGSSSAAGVAETEQWRSRLGRFLGAAPRRPVVVYVGTNQHRRGYDRLLRLALAEDGVFLHCGRFALYGEPSDADVSELRAELVRRGALLETGAQYLSADTAALFLAAARCVVLPYREHDGSSGVMLQALAVGRPVLVPDRGLMAYRARTFAVGEVCRDGDRRELQRHFRLLNAERSDARADRLAAFMAYFSVEQVSVAVRAALTGSGPGASLPGTSLRRQTEGRPQGSD